MNNIPDPEMTPLALLAALLRRWRLVVGVPLVIGTLTATLILLKSRTYTTSTAFAPSGGASGASRFAGIAAQLGLATALPGGGDQSPDVLVELIRSDSLLREVARDSVWIVTGGDTTWSTLAELYEVGGKTENERLYAVIERFRKGGILTVGTGLKTGLVNVSITTRWKSVSLQLAQRVVALVNRYNVESRQGRAAAEAEFTQDRLAEAQEGLRSAEDQLQAFLSRNRQYQSSPALSFEVERLQRRVQMQQDVYTVLAQGLAQARLEALRDVPTITVVEPPVTALLPDRRGLVIKGLAAGIIGIGLGIMLALALEYWERMTRAVPTEAEAVRVGLRTAWVEFTGILRRRGR